MCPQRGSPQRRGQLLLFQCAADDAIGVRLPSSGTRHYVTQNCWLQLLRGNAKRREGRTRVLQACHCGGVFGNMLIPAASAKCDEVGRAALTDAARIRARSYRCAVRVQRCVQPSSRVGLPERSPLRTSSPLSVLLLRLGMFHTACRPLRC